MHKFIGIMGASHLQRPSQRRRWSRLFVFPVDSEAKRQYCYLWLSEDLPLADAKIDWDIGPQD